MSTLIDLLAQRALKTPGGEACTSLSSDLSIKNTLTYSGLHTEATRLAFQLQRMLPEKSSVALLFDCGVEFLPFYFAVQMAGMQAIPLCPTWRRSETLLEKLLQQLNELTIIVADSHSKTTLRRLQENHPAAKAFAASHFIENATDSPPATAELPCVLADHTAHIQFSSGSEGDPKGVALSHANVLDNLARIERAFGLKTGDKGLIWLPLYHDMGLIGGLLAPIYSGFPVYTIKPAHFSSDPSCWLRAISTYGITVSGGPNIAYDICTRIDLETGTQLDTWRVAFIGAEPVRADTIRGFSNKWQTHGFSETSFISCYGLAESTLMVTAGSRHQRPQSILVERNHLESGEIIAQERPSPSTLELISGGKEVENGSVQIFDTDRQACPRNRVGEIGVAGASLSAGYLKDGENRWRTVMCNGQSYFLTGDEGFWDDNDNLYILARNKEKIQIGGRTVYLSDMESCLKEKLRDDRRIADLYCAYDTAGNTITVFAETVTRSIRDHAKEIEAATYAEQLRTHYNHEFFMRYGIGIGNVHLLGKGKLPRTSSGKVQRHLLAGVSMPPSSPSLGIVQQETNTPATPADFLYLEEEIVIAGIFRDVIGIINSISHDDTFYAVGGCSIHVAPVISRINSAFGTKIGINEFMQNNSIRHLALKVIASKELS